MDREKFIAAVISGAKARGLLVQAGRGGRLSICFNRKSRKKLHTDHLGRLFDLGYADPMKNRKSLNALIEQVAPGRPCTHVGMREIVSGFPR